MLIIGDHDLICIHFYGWKYKWKTKPERHGDGFKNSGCAIFEGFEQQSLSAIPPIVTDDISQLLGMISPSSYPFKPQLHHHR